MRTYIWSQFLLSTEKHDQEAEKQEIRCED